MHRPSIVPPIAAALVALGLLLLGSPTPAVATAPAGAPHAPAQHP